MGGQHGTRREPLVASGQAEESNARHAPVAQLSGVTLLPSSSGPTPDTGAEISNLGASGDGASAPAPLASAIMSWVHDGLWCKPSEQDGWCVHSAKRSECSQRRRW